MCNKRIKPQENFLPHLTQEKIDRNPPEFARLLGADEWMGWSDPTGPKWDNVLKYGDPKSTRHRLLKKERGGAASA